MTSNQQIPMNELDYDKGKISDTRETANMSDKPEMSTIIDIQSTPSGEDTFGNYGIKNLLSSPTLTETTNAGQIPVKTENDDSGENNILSSSCEISPVADAKQNSMEEVNSKNKDEDKISDSCQISGEEDVRHICNDNKMNLSNSSIEQISIKSENFDSDKRNNLTDSCQIYPVTDVKTTFFEEDIRDRDNVSCNCQKSEVEDVNQALIKENVTKTLNLNISYKKILFILLKLIIFVICTAGFIFQATDYLNYYWTYPTVVELKLETRDEFILPAITFCHIKSAASIELCRKYPDKCLVPNGKICQRYPDYCKNQFMIPDTDKLISLRNVTLYDLQDLDPPFNFKFGHIPASDLNTEGFKVSDQFWSVTPYTFNASRCHTWMSRVGSKMEARKTLLETKTSNSDEYLIVVLQTVAPKRDLNVTHSFSVKLHSPFEVDHMDKSKTMNTRGIYEIHISMEEEELLPYPYRTDCMNYTEFWINNNRTGPRSQKMCKEICRMKFDFVCFKCINIWNVYPTRIPKCVIAATNRHMCKHLEKGYGACISHCKAECSKTRYIYSIKEKPEGPLDYYSNHNPEGMFTFIYLDPKVLVYKHKPQIQPVEIFSNIGGYLGIWLGISLFALTDIARYFITHINAWLTKIMSRKAKKRNKTLKK